MADKKKKPESVRVPAGIVRPTWADPRYILATNEGTFDVATPGNGTPLLVAKNNPKRWAIGFARELGDATSVMVAPQNQVVTKGHLLPSTYSIEWFTLFDFGPFVQYEWYAQSVGATTIGVYEVEIH